MYAAVIVLILEIQFVLWPLLLDREFFMEISIILSAKEVILKVLISLSLDN